VVVVGIAGLTWNDINQQATPHLYAMAGSAADGALLVRGVRQRTCAADGWLTLGAGVRTLAPRPMDSRGVEVCTALTEPRALPGTAPGGNWSVDLDLGAVAQQNAAFYSPPLGNVGDSLAAAGQCSTAVGRGAALMLMTSKGEVSNYSPNVSAVDAALLSRCDVTAIDLGQLPPGPQPPGQERLLPADESGAQRLGSSHADGLTLLDAEVARIQSQLAPDSTLALVSTADDTWEPRIRVLVVEGPGPDGTTYDHGVLWSPGTRQPGLIQLTDVTALVLATVDVMPVHPVVGSVPEVHQTDRAVASTIADLSQQDLRAQAIRITSYKVTQGLAYGLVLLIVLALVQWIWVRRRPQPATRLAHLDRLWQIAFVYVASLPAATFLANSLPWDHTDSAARAAGTVIALSFAVGAVLSLVALLGPWRRWSYGPVMVMAVVTLAILVADVTTGSRLQLDALFGLAPLVGGRFYGFGNVAFSLFGVAALFTTIGVVQPYLRAQRRRAAGFIVAGIGLVCALIDGWPRFGADFGGMIALVAAFATMATLVVGARLSWRRVLGIAVAAVVVPVIVAFLDWLRPAASRTHLGQFVQSAFDGTAGDTIVRKATASVASFGDFLLAPLVPVIVLGLALVILAPLRVGARRVPVAYREVLALRAGLIGCLVLSVVGWLVNDSGLIVTEVVMVLAIPLGVAAVVGVRPPAPPPPGAATPPEPRRHAASP
jgi:hypothetical protein